MKTKEFSIIQPDDWHLHLREGAMLRAVVPATSSSCRRAIIMPNLVPPVTTLEHAERYRREIEAAVPKGESFTPLMTLYLTETFTPQRVIEAAECGFVKAMKLYPAGATTNSDSGVRDFHAILPVLEKMAEVGMPLLVHGEVTDADVDIFDREAVFIETVLDPIRRAVPGLKVVMEHITTSAAVEYVRGEDATLAATITVHHLVINRNAILVGGIHPHCYCLPVAKREEHRLALRRAAVSGEGKFFFGSDSAPHLDPAKIAPCGCAGIFTAPNALECLATVFEQEGRLEALEPFASLNGPAFYGLPANDSRLRLYKTDEPLSLPSTVETGAGGVTIFDPMFPLHWRIHGKEY